MQLGENIRKLRKERGMTQEELAEVFNVTVGAVYKWESGRSIPELELLVQLAQFFEQSVDALIGYTLEGSSVTEGIQRLKRAVHSKDYSELPVAERLLQKYPYNFNIVYLSSKLYKTVGVIREDPSLVRRALTLEKQSLTLLDQNEDKRVNAFTITQDMASSHLFLEETEQALKLYQDHNDSGVFNDVIGQILAIKLDRPEAGADYLMESLVNNLIGLLRTVTGLMARYDARKEYAEGIALLNWLLNTYKTAAVPEKSGYLWRLQILLYVHRADFQWKLGESQLACTSLESARDLAEQFDASPNFTLDHLKFGLPPFEGTFTDDIGRSGIESIESYLSFLENDDLHARWKELLGHECE